MAVEYDPEMKEKQKQEQELEKRNSEASSFQAKLESDVYATQSGSKRALSLLFKQEENEESELLEKQGTEEKDSIQKYEAISASMDAVKSDKQDSSRECEIQSVVIQDVEPGVLQPSLQLEKDLVKLETSTEASNVLSTNEKLHVQTENLNVNEPKKITTTGQVGSVSVVDNMREVETCITADGIEIPEKTGEASYVTGDASSSFKDEKVNDNNEKSLKSGTGLPFVDVKNTSAHKEGKNYDANIEDLNEDTSKDSDAYIKSSQVPQVEVTTANDIRKVDAENGPLSGENYDHDTNSTHTIVGNSAFDNVQVQSLVAENKQSFNNVQDARSDVMMPIGCSLQDTSTVTENIDEPSIKNHQKNSLLVKTEENILENLEARGIQENRAVLADGSQEKASGWSSENANLKSNDDSHSNLVIAMTEGKTTDSKEAPVGEPMATTVSTYSPTPSVFEASTMLERKLEEKSIEESHGTFKLVGDGENRMENREREALEEEVREIKEGLSETKSGSQKAYIDKDVNQGSEILGKDISPSEMNQERLSDSNLLVLESDPKENGAVSPTNVGKGLVENGNAFSEENIKSPVINTLSAKQDSQSKDIADNSPVIKSPEAKQE